jgi:hypothetical protein
MPNVPVDVLWCSNNRSGRSNGWSYPPKVERFLQDFTKGRSVLQLFGGMSRWGTKIDIDRSTRPHVIADAWLPPFGVNSFDVVILDPPYVSINQQMKQQLLRGAAFVAREHVVWFHTMWIASDRTCRLERALLVRVGDSCACRCIQIFRAAADTPRPRLHFSRGPAIRYNRWLSGQQRMPFDGSVEKEPPSSLRCLDGVQLEH